MVLFCQNTSRDQRTIFSGLLGMTVVENLNNYLGLPIPIGKKKSAAFKEITNRLSYRINSWTKWLLSFGGKEVFIKTVLQSIPMYAMSIFLVPKGIIDDIQEKLSRAWWAGKEKGRYWAMIPWKTLCKLKAMGALGIRDVLGGAPVIHLGGASANRLGGAPTCHFGSIGPWSCRSLRYHRHLGARMCGSLGHHRQPRPLVVRDPREPSAPRSLDVREPRTLSTNKALGRAGSSGTIGTWALGCVGASDTIASGTIVTWVLGCAGASNTIGKLGPWLCGSLGHHRLLGAMMCGSLGHCRASGTISKLGPWSCKSLGHHWHFGGLDVRELGHHRPHRPLIVREPRAPLGPGRSDVRERQTPSANKTLGRAGASGTIGSSDTIGKLGPWSYGHALGLGRASGTIGYLGPWSCESVGHHRHLGAWMCESLGHHRQTRPLVIQEPRASSAPWCYDVREPRAPPTPWCWMGGNLGQHQQPRPLVVREPWAPLAPGRSDEPQTLSATLVLGWTGASSTIGTLVPGMCGLKKCPSFEQKNVSCGELVAGARGQEDDFPASQARAHRNVANQSRTRAHRNVANDSRTKFPIRAKISWGGLCIAMGSSLACPFAPVTFRDALCIPTQQPHGGLALPSPCPHFKLPVTLVPSPFEGNGSLGVSVEFVGSVLARPSPSGILPLVVLVPSGCGVPSFVVPSAPLSFDWLGGLLAGVRGRYYYADVAEECYLVDLASSHMLVSKIKPCIKGTRTSRFLDPHPP
ncbi:hypothetical protein GOBAR_DD19256 [Gossypium barbadense]|nr:hypothetical protein GOBAR_DD19256 [Gossypium barbadense]